MRALPLFSAPTRATFLIVMSVTAFLAVMIAASQAHAAGSYSGGGDDSNSESTPKAAKKMHASLRAAKLKLGDADYEGALGDLALVISDEPDNADAWNLTGYSHRKNGDYEASQTAYEKALAIDPNHKGALEYMGELYLTLGDLPAAENLLRRLKNACSYFCSERDTLKKAIKTYKKNNS